MTSADRSGFGVALSFFSAFLSACGNDDKTPASGNGSSLSFYAADYGQGSAIYALDLTSFQVSPAIPHARYVDAKLFFDHKTGDFFVATRNPLEEGASTLTRVASDGRRVVGELGGLPVNLFGLLRISGERFLATGWNSGQVAVVPPSLAMAAVSTRVPESLPSGVENRRFVGALGAGASTFIVSGGTDAGFQPQPAQIHRLGSDYAKVSSSSPVADCRNISGDGNEGFLLLTAGRAVVSCNPRYNQTRSTWSGALALVLLEVTGDAIVARSLATASNDADFDMYLIRAASSDGSAVLVEEAASIATDPYVSVKARYWLDVASGKRTPVLTYGGQGLFQKSIDGYVFSCSPDGQGGCKRGTFCLVRNDAFEAQRCEEKPVRFDYTFRSFPQPIPEAP